MKWIFGASGWGLLSLVFMFAGCGSGGGGSAPTPPELTLTPQAIKTLRFTWEPDGAATGYHLFEDPDGSSGFVEIAEIDGGVDHHDLTVFLPGRVNARYLLRACNRHGCTDSPQVHVEGSLAEAVGYFKASNTGEGDGFGSSLALSADGDTMAIGAPREDDGAVYVFVREGGTWSRQAHILPRNVARAEFGSSVALSADGDTLAVGAWRESSGAGGTDGDSNAVYYSGAAYVFTRQGGVWSEEAYLKDKEPLVRGHFGKSVALSAAGDTLAVGAPGVLLCRCDADDLAGGLSWGAVQVYARDDGVWREQARMETSGPTWSWDQFGLSIALSADGHTLAIGASRDRESVNQNGAVYIHVRSGDTWSEQAYIENPTEYSQWERWFGYAVALSADGNTLAVGAPFESTGALGSDERRNEIGAVYVYTRSGDAWVQQARMEAPEARPWGYFGSGVALSADGDLLVVGATGDRSGATGINGDPHDDSLFGTGAAHTFTRSHGDWTPQAYIKASNTRPYWAWWFDSFGVDVALSGAGDVLAVAWPAEDSGATGINGDQQDDSAPRSGAVYLY